MKWILYKPTLVPQSGWPKPVCPSGFRPQQRADDLGDLRRFQRVLAQRHVGALRVDDPDLARMTAGERLDLPGITVGEDDVFGLDVDPIQRPGARQDPQLGLQEQVLGGSGRRTEAVVQLLAKVGQMVEAAQARQAAIELELDPGPGYVILGQVGSPGKLDRAIEERLRGLVGQRADGRFQQRAVELVADAFDMA